MTTAVLGNPLVIVKAVEPCDGQCGGEITLWTDLVLSASAVSHPATGRRFFSQDAEGIARTETSIVVSCGAMNLGDEQCEGTATFLLSDLTTYGQWLPATPGVLSFLNPMEREG